MQIGDLDSYEASKARLRDIEAAESDAVSSQDVTKPRSPKGGRPVRSDSVREVAKRTGLSKNDVARTRKHVSIGEELPGMQAAEWRKSHSLRADECLQDIGDEHRETFSRMASEPGIDGKTGVAMLENVAKQTHRRSVDIQTLLFAQ